MGDSVTGRVVEQSPSLLHVELGEGIRGISRIGQSASALPEPPATAHAHAVKLDLSALSSQLKNRWKGNTPSSQIKPDPIATGQIRSFKITKLDAGAKQIEVELA